MIPGSPGITIQIPAGVTDNAMFMLRGVGAPTYPGGPASDVVIKVQIRQSASQPYSAMPYSAPPQSGPPAYGAPPQSGQPAYGAPQSGRPAYGAPQAGPPAYAPQSGQPAYGAPQSGQPAYGAPGQPGQLPYGAVPPVAPPAKGGIPVWLRIVAPLVALVLLACCCFGAWKVWGSDEDPLVGPSSSPGFSAPPDAPPATPEEYQQALTDADTALAAGFKTLAAAKSPKAIGTAAAALQDEVRTVSGKLEGLVPPVPAAAAHRSLVSGLSQLVSELGSTASAADASEICRGSAAQAMVSSSSALDSLREVASTLGAVDSAKAYSFGTSLPKQTKLGNRRLSNGTMVKSISSRGPGELKITNAGTDSVISLVLVGKTKPTLSVYMRASQSRTITGVPNGTYRVFWTTGKDWDKKAKAFTQNCSFAKFDDSLRFTSSGGQYTIWTISLRKSAGGNAPSSGVDPDDFPGG